MKQKLSDIKNKSINLLQDNRKLQLDKELFAVQNYELISELKETRPGAILYQLGNNIKKQDFKFTTLKSHNNTVLLDSFAKLFTSSHPYNAVALVQDKFYVSLSQGVQIDVVSINQTAYELINKFDKPNIKKLLSILIDNDNYFVSFICRDYKSELFYANKNLVHIPKYGSNIKHAQQKTWELFIDSLSDQDKYKILEDIYHYDKKGTTQILTNNQYYDFEYSPKGTIPISIQNNIYAIIIKVFDNNINSILHKYYDTYCNKVLLGYLIDKDTISIFDIITKQDLDNIKQLQIEHKLVEQVKPDDLYRNAHVELNLLSKISKDGLFLYDIFIGLSSSDIYDKDSGCCGYCVATLDSVAITSNIRIYRSKDFSQNIPFKDWHFPHKLLNSDNKVILFLKNILTQYKSIIQKNLGDEHSYNGLDHYVQVLDENSKKVDSIMQLIEKNNSLIESSYLDILNIPEIKNEEMVVNVIGSNENVHFEHVYGGGCYI
ncbi:hypothetical protein Trichorick_01525 (plasmid) [Candidatus Trichorickettsia mobilis]|uniref:hypothetical protein n=1 Tax=Candidatus Trichorickettsia mobilis TaxID=1346319 RepID=UPI002B261246|nr:hypothetical protein [Candidatus Trichorickettsia mobilis]WPY01611.1 hypothetical protein Trichorick_01525 [Candidatus Trichorickettsia mobilis]